MNGSNYKGTWEALARTPIDARLAVAGYADEAQMDAPGQGHARGRGRPHAKDGGRCFFDNLDITSDHRVGMMRGSA